MIFTKIFSPIVFRVFIFLAVRAIILNFFGDPIIIYEFKKGVLFKNGKPIKILNPGKHRLFSCYARVIEVDIRSVKSTLRSSSFSLDKKYIDFEVVISFKVDDPIQYIINSGQDMFAIVEGESKIVLRDAFLEYDHDMIYSCQAIISENLLKNIGAKTHDKGIKIESVDLILFTLTTTNNNFVN